MLFEFSKTIEEAFHTAADKARAMNTEFVSKEIMLLCVLACKGNRSDTGGWKVVNNASFMRYFSVLSRDKVQIARTSQL